MKYIYSKKTNEVLVSLSSSSYGPRSVRALSAPYLRSSQMPPGNKEWNPALALCPIALHMSMLGEERVSCRCSRHKVPSISDVEYDEFVMKLCPEKQLIVIAVKSSL